MTEQPKEYIITGDEIDEIEKRFNDLIEKGTIPREEDCSNTLDNIRSHPVSIGRYCEKAGRPIRRMHTCPAVDS